ncbi:hypothetical protein J6590_031964 [Homalodisca vitripennis]|nr:hypothetical protein J6590_031964 [Homalodisca vitripennis]
MRIHGLHTPTLIFRNITPEIWNNVRLNRSKKESIHCTKMADVITPQCHVRDDKFDTGRISQSKLPDGEVTELLANWIIRLGSETGTYQLTTLEPWWVSGARGGQVNKDWPTAKQVVLVSTAEDVPSLGKTAECIGEDATATITGCWETLSGRQMLGWIRRGKLLVSCFKQLIDHTPDDAMVEDMMTLRVRCYELVNPLIIDTAFKCANLLLGVFSHNRSFLSRYEYLNPIQDFRKSHWDADHNETKFHDGQILELTLAGHIAVLAHSVGLILASNLSETMTLAAMRIYLIRRLQSRLSKTVQRNRTIGGKSNVQPQEVDQCCDASGAHCNSPALGTILMPCTIHLVMEQCDWPIGHGARQIKTNLTF